MDDANTTMLYNSIFKVVHDTRRNPGTWNYWLCQLIINGKYFVEIMHRPPAPQLIHDLRKI